MFQQKIDQMKKLLLFLFCGVLYVTGCTDKIGSDIIAHGTTGTLTWTLSTDGMLTISETGEMQDYRVVPTEFLPQWFEYRNNISSVMIGNEVSNIGDYAFFRCENLTSVTIGNSINAIGIRAFSGCSSLTSVVIPNSVVTIGDDAFSGCKSLTSIIISNSATDIGNAAFYQCERLVSVIIPNSVTIIGNEAFFGCKSLQSIIIPNSVTDIGESAFYFCDGLTSVTINHSVTTIGNDAFRNCSSLTELINYQEIPQMINYSMFDGINKTICTLLVPAGSVEVYRDASGWDSFYKIGVIGDPGSIVTSGKAGALTWILSNDKLLTISGTGEMPDYYDGMKTSYLPSWMVYQESITHVIIEDGINSIGSQAFKCYGNGCYSNLSSVIIGSSIISIGYSAFGSCIGLTEIVNHQEIPQTIDEYVFGGVNKTECTLFVPAGSMAAYRTAEGWKDFANIKAIQ